MIMVVDMRARFYVTNDTYVKDGVPVEWFDEVNSIDDLFRHLDKWNKDADNVITTVDSLVIRRYDDSDKTNAARDGRVICDIAVEIYNDYRE